LFPPGVERAFLQATLTAERADRLARFFLLADPLAPRRAALCSFPLHASTMRLASRIGQRGLCDAYGDASVLMTDYSNEKIALGYFREANSVWCSRPSTEVLHP
jgi:hypothetical protein